MNMTNNVTAKVFGELLAKGMSLADVDMNYTVKSEAIDALCEIKNALLGEKTDEDKVKAVSSVLEKYMIL